MLHIMFIKVRNKKLGSYFNIKDSTKLEYQHGLTFFTQCAGVNCNETYLGEAARRLREKVLKHAGKSNMVKNSMDTEHPAVCMKDFQVLT